MIFFAMYPAPQLIPGLGIRRWDHLLWVKLRPRLAFCVFAYYH